MDVEKVQDETSVDFQPDRKDNCYTFSIKHMDIWKENVENYYFSGDSDGWQLRKKGDTMLRKYTCLDRIFTITLYKTGTVCFQGNSKSLDYWYDHQFRPLMNEYRKILIKKPTNNLEKPIQGMSPKVVFFTEEPFSCICTSSVLFSNTGKKDSTLPAGQTVTTQ